MTYISESANIRSQKVVWRTMEEEKSLRDSYQTRESVKNAGNPEMKKKNYYRLVNGRPAEGATEGWRKNEWLVESGYFLLDFDEHDINITRKAWKKLSPHIKEWGIVHAEMSARGGMHVTCIRSEGLTIEENIRLVELKSGLTFDHCHDLARACFIVPNKLVVYETPAYYSDTTPLPLPLKEEDRQLLEQDKEVREATRKKEIEQRSLTAPEIHFESTADDEACLIAIVDAITEQKVDITANYPEWIDIGFCIANITGSAGEYLYHQVSCFYPGYNYAETSNTYRGLVRTTRGEVGLGTLIYLARREGVMR